jgi:hypothetical protein
MKTFVAKEGILLKIVNCKEFSIYQADSNNPSYLVKVNLLDNEEKQSFLKASTKFLRKALITTLKEIYEGFVNDDL